VDRRHRRLPRPRQRSQQLKPGVNQIAVRIGTLLGNARGQTLTQGLVGPVRIVPYGQATVYASTDATGTIGGTVPATLSLALGGSTSLGAFTPGVERTYDASLSATVTSTAGDAALSVSDPSSNATGRLTNATYALTEPLQLKAGSGAFAPLTNAPLTLLTYNAPVSNDAISIGVRQHIVPAQALRTGAYSKTLTFTLSTTTP
jgi:hypothetical protein